MRVKLKTSFVLLYLVISAGCPDEGNSSVACNANKDCPSGQHCTNGICTAAVNDSGNAENQDVGPVDSATNDISTAQDRTQTDLRTGDRYNLSDAHPPVDAAVVDRWIATDAVQIEVDGALTDASPLFDLGSLTDSRRPDAGMMQTDLWRPDTGSLDLHRPDTTGTDTSSTLQSWMSVDIGAVDGPGSTHIVGDTIEVTVVGGDIVLAADAFRYVYFEALGDLTFTAQIQSQGQTGSWAKSGLMARATLSPDSKHASIFVTADATNPVRFEYRDQVGATNTGSSGTATGAPFWLRLQRIGDVFRGYESADGVTWTLVGSQTVAMDAGIWLGLAVSAHTSDASCTSVIDNISVGEQPPECVSAEDCDDDAPETIDICNLGNCSHIHSGQLPVYPGAEGFGTDTVAGRGGQILRVTNLNDSGSGSLRAAVEASGARIIVFDVGGVILLNSDLHLASPYCTIAGQTAPGDGIMVRNYGLRITTHDVLIQHLAIRPGDDGRLATGEWDNLDALQITGGSAYNIVIDHLSISWGIDENASVWASHAHDITFSNCIIAEGLVQSAHSEGAHSKGLLIGGDGNNPKDVAIINNLFAHNVDRNPQLKGGTSVVVANNLMYNAGDSYSTSNLTRNYVVEINQASYLGNMFKDGPNSASSAYSIKVEAAILSGSQVYQNDNQNISRPSYLYKDNADVTVGEVPIEFMPHSLLHSSSTMQSVLLNAGSRPTARDAVDERIANPTNGEVVAGGGQRRDHSAGLWPVYATVNQAFYAGDNPGADDDGDGYTNVEERLHAAAAAVEGR